LRLGFADRPIGVPAEIVPKPFAECLPFCKSLEAELRGRKPRRFGASPTGATTVRS
jgi:hypothetical protein